MKAPEKNRRVGLSGEARVWILSVGMAALAGLAFVFVLRDLSPWPAPFHLSWWMLAPGYVLAEIMVVHVQLRREAYSISTSEIPLVLGLFLATPADLFIAHLVGGVIALGLIRRQRPIRVAFNVSHFLVETAGAVLIFRALAIASDPIGPYSWLAAIGAAFVVDLFAGIAVHLAISLAERGRTGLPRLVGIGSLASVSNASIALLLAALLWFRPLLGLLLIVPGMLVVLGYRAYHSQRRNHEGLQRLYESTRALQREFDAESVMLAVLAQTRTALSGDFAEILLFPEAGESGLRASSGPEEEITPPSPVEFDPTHTLWARVAAEGQALAISPPITSPRMSAYFEERGITNAMAAPLFQKGAVSGILVVGNGLGEIGEFGADDIRLFEMLAQHASVSLEKGALVADLQRQAEENEFQARHDALTGLRNRYSFLQETGEVIEHAGDSVLAAVLLLDLDRFKEINDSLGHATGDAILTEVAARLMETAGEDEIVARLGGDEFALFVPSAESMAAVGRRAEGILVSLERPFGLEGLSVDIGASIGIALYPTHGADAQTLVQRADVAMYVAKDEHRGHEVYSPANDRYSPSRLKLVADLRLAIESGELEVHYQPKVELGQGRVLGVEALVRWNHPRNGLMAPDEFVPLAEHTGLIGPLTTHVLNRSLEEARKWVTAGIDDFHVSVNISVRNLLDASLADEIGRMLERWELPAGCLQLEITESHIMVDPSRAIAVLTKLDDMGVGLSIDDFGTGYSSLAYLKRLPVREIKVDKSFVLGMIVDENDALIVRSVIDLGRNLGLSVVAEGIENRELWTRLSGMGCEVGQGFHIARPLPSDRLEEWMWDNLERFGSQRQVVPLSLRRRVR